VPCFNADLLRTPPGKRADWLGGGVVVFGAAGKQALCGVSDVFTQC
jgi:hypothetical protein